MKSAKLIILVIIAALTSCDVDQLNPDVDKNGLIKKIEDETGEVVAQYNYNPDGTLKTSWFHMDVYMHGENEEYEYQYDSNQRLTEKEGLEPGNMIMSSMTGASKKEVRVTYEYDNYDRLIKLNKVYAFDNSDWDYEISTVFKYPENNVITEHVVHAGGDVESVSEWKFDENGNIFEVEHLTVENDVRRLNSKEFRTYDDKKVPFNFEPLPTSKNNLIEKEIVVYDYNDAGEQSVSYTSTFVYSYEYNADGFPTKETETYPNKIEKVKIYTYL